MFNNRSALTLALGLTAAATLFGGNGTARAQRLSVSASGPETVTINDKVNKNQFVWISEAPLENIKGSSEGVTGSFTIDPQDLSKIRGTITTETKTMNTGNGTRNNHLWSSEWLDVAKYPTISFAITSVDRVAATGNSATAMATGNFTMHGVTKKMTVPFKLTYIMESDKTRQRAPGDFVMISADFTISLKDFKVAGSEGTVGSKVGETIKINAQLFGNVTKKGAAS